MLMAKYQWQESEDLTRTLSLFDPVSSFFELCTPCLLLSLYTPQNSVLRSQRLFETQITIYWHVLELQIDFVTIIPSNLCGSRFSF